MPRSRIVIVLSTTLSWLVLGAVFAAPPKSTASKKRTGDGFVPTKTADKESDSSDSDDDDEKKVVKSDKEWMKILSREQFRVTRKNAAERPYAGKLWNNKRDGVYECVCCGRPLFDSKDKVDSKNGYPCFKGPIDEKRLTIADDKKRIECSRCDANLGQVMAGGGTMPGGPMPGVPMPNVPMPNGAVPPAGAGLPGANTPPAGTLPAGNPPGTPVPPAGAPAGPGAGKAGTPQPPAGTPAAPGAANPGATPPAGTAPPPGGAVPPAGAAPPAGGAVPPPGGATPPHGGNGAPAGGAIPPPGGAIPPAGAVPPAGGAMPPGGAGPGGAGPGASPPGGGGREAEKRYCLNNQSIKFVARADFNKAHKKK